MKFDIVHYMSILILVSLVTDLHRLKIFNKIMESLVSDAAILSQTFTLIVSSLK